MVREFVRKENEKTMKTKRVLFTIEVVAEVPVRCKNKNLDVFIPIDADVVSHRTQNTVTGGVISFACVRSRTLSENEIIETNRIDE